MFGGGRSNKLDDLMINLRMNSKMLERESKKAEKDEKAYRLKVKKAIEEHNMEVAQVHAETAIRKKNESLNYLRMASRLDGTASRVKSAANMQSVAKSMGGVIKGLDSAMRSMDLVKVQQVMDKFEEQCGSLDVMTATMDGAMNTASSTLTPADQVKSLINQVAAENGLEVQLALNEPQPGDLSATNISQQENDNLQQRLANLRS